MDRKMGTVLDALESTELGDNTIIICTTDHGIPFPGMKCRLKDAGTKVMLIMKDGAELSGGNVVDGMVNNIDIFPSLCDYLGIDIPDHVEGRSFMPLVRGEKEEVNEALFFEINYHAAYEPLRAVRTNRWKYIRRFEPRERPVLINCDGSLSKEQWLDAGWSTKPPAEEALYDLILDPNEQNNLAGNSEFSEVLKNMRDKLEQHMRESNDPLVTEGDVPLPATASLNSRDSIDGSDGRLPDGQR